MTNTVSLAVAAAVAPLTMAAGCTCGGMLGGGDEDFYDGLHWCECSRSEMRPARPVLTNLIPISGREITARYEEAQRLYAAFPPISPMSRDLAAEMLDVMRSVYDVPRVVALA